MGKGSARLRVLLSAYGCQPGKGSEFGVGWNHVMQSARFNDVWVITRSSHRNVIENELRVRPNSRIQWMYFDLPGCTRPWKHMFFIRLYYYIWQLGAYFVARGLHKKVQFDVAHHVTFVTYSSPTFLAFLPIPFIWGPVGGGESAPRAFLKSFGVRGAALEMLRHISRSIGERDPLVRLAARRAALALATTHETAKRLARMGCRKVEVMSESGLSAPDLAALGAIPLPDREGEPFRIVTIGRVLYWKGHELALRAFAKFHQDSPDSEYWIIGDGSDRSRLEQLARSLEVSEHVTFFGSMTRAQAFDKMACCHLMLFPSLHDSGGWVCLEAMAAQRAIVCLDLGGPGLQVTSETGIKIRALTPKQAIAEMAEALGHLATDHSRRRRLGKAGRARVEHCFNWDRKGEKFATLYASVVGVRNGTLGQPGHASKLATSGTSAVAPLQPTSSLHSS